MPHRARHRAVLRDVGKADLHQLFQVPLKEARRLHRRHEYLRVHALAVAVVDHRVLHGVARRQLRVPREQARPDLRADEGAAAVLEFVVVRARHRRLQPRAQVGLGDAVLAVGEDHQLVEVLPQILAVHVQSLVLQRQQPQHLDVQIVVGQRLARHFMRVIADLVLLAVPLHGHAQRAAHVFADPAAQHAPAVVLKRKIHRIILPVTVFVLIPHYTPSARACPAKIRHVSLYKQFTRIPVDKPRPAH